MLYSVCLPFGGRGGANPNDNASVDFFKYSYSMATGDSQHLNTCMLCLLKCVTISSFKKRAKMDTKGWRHKEP
jgi:hypothetical protein